MKESIHKYTVFNEETYKFHPKSKGCFLRKKHFVKVIWSKVDNLISKFFSNFAIYLRSQ